MRILPPTGSLHQTQKVTVLFAAEQPPIERVNFLYHWVERLYRPHKNPAIKRAFHTRGMGMLGLIVLFSVVGFNVHAAPLLEPQPLPDEAYGEAYTAVASMADGSFVLTQMMFSNAGMGSRKAACRALWVPPGKAGINASARFTQDQWAYDADTDTLTAGTCSLAAQAEGLRFIASVPELTIDLTIQAGARSVTPPGHRIDFKQSFYAAKLLVPYAKTQAIIKAGENTLETNGVVHIDHSRSNVLMPNAAACWLRFRGFYGSSPTLLQVRVPPKGGAPDSWVWPLNEAVPKAIPSDDVRLGTNENGYPTISIAGTVGLEITPAKQLYRYRPAESYGAIGKLASPWIGDPTTTTYRAKAKTASGGSISGILEVLEVDDPGCVTQ